jgi:hypothetical protein
VKTIPKKIREEAALICAIAASTPDLFANYDAVVEGLGASEEARDLALCAWWFVCCRVSGYDPGTLSSVDAEAAALLLEGWVPEDWL